VVIADDEPDVVLLLTLQLRTRSEVEVVGVATDADEVVAQCRSQRPDALVLDLLMPGMQGFGVIERLRDELPDLGIVAYSAVAGDFVRNEMERLAVPLVLKSGRSDPLVAAIVSSVGLRREGDSTDADPGPG
jgi:DNA-binding NarL/FixJ family response regulator